MLRAVASGFGLAGTGGESRRVYRLEEETEADWWEVEALYDLCFAPGRTALSSYRLRDGVPTVAPLCLTCATMMGRWPRSSATGPR